MYVLGLNWRWHDTAAVMVDSDGNIPSCGEEERFTV